MAPELSERSERAPGRRLGRVPRHTLAGAIVGAIVAGALMLFSAPAEAAPRTDRTDVVAASSPR